MSTLTIGYLWCFPTQISEKYSIVICYGWRVLTQNWGSQTVQCVLLHKTDIVTTLHHGEVVVERWKFRYAAIQRKISVSTDSKSTWRKIRKKKHSHISDFNAFFQEFKNALKKFGTFCDCEKQPFRIFPYSALVLR